MRADDGTGAQRTGRSSLRIAILALSLSALLAAPALGDATLPGNPVTAYNDDLGAIQFRYGAGPGVFFDPSVDPGHAGLEVVTDDGTYYSLDDPSNRSSITPATLGGSPPTRTITSAYSLGGDLRVDQTLTYTDGTQFADLHYVFTNLRPTTPITFRAAEIADLYVAGNDSGTGVIAPGPPRFVGGRDPLTGVVSGLQEVAGSPWSGYEEDFFQSVFDAFRTGAFDNAVDFDPIDNGVGVQWTITLAPGAQQAADARWLLAAPAPAGSIISAPASPATSTTPATPAAGPPPPVAGKTVNIHLANGVVLYRLPHSKKFVKLTADTQIPLGSTLDTTHGRVTLISASDLKGSTNHAWFYSGVFTVGQTKGAKPVTELTLAGQKPVCAKGSSASAAAKKPKSRKLWGDGSGQFRTRGQFSSATVRGTKWVVEDECAGTLTRVVRGVVAVRDDVKHRTIILRAGKQYLARRK